MKIKKVSTTKPMQGYISDTENVDDKTTNAPSLRLTDEMINEKGVAVSATEPTTGERVWIQKGKNLFDKNKVVEGYELQNTDGSISKVDTWWVSEYISVKSNETYYLSANENRSKGTTNAFYDENKNYLSYVEVITGAILIPENVKYVRFNGRIDEIDSNIMFEQGTVATEYEEYIEPKIHVKNDNGVYEEFMKKEEIYSTDEQVIGTWIDGKPLYRQSGETTFTGTMTTEQTVDLVTISPKWKFKKIEGVFNFYDTANYMYQSLTANASVTGNTTSMYKSGSETIRAKFLHTVSGIASVTILWTIEYTKTTD